jgi:hypothetical protein
MKTLSAVTLAVLIALSSVSFGANLITNGGFETPVVGSGGNMQFLSGSSGLTGWTIGGTDVYLLDTGFTFNGVTFNSHSGNQALDITGVGNSGANTISQTIATVIGTSYTLSFWLGNAHGTIPAYSLASSVSLSVTGLGNMAFTNAAITLNAVNWALQTLTFTASSSSTTLTFTNTTPTADGYAGLDDITLDAVPDAGSSLLLLGLVVLGLFGAARVPRLSRTD